MKLVGYFVGLVLQGWQRLWLVSTLSGLSCKYGLRKCRTNAETGWLLCWWGLARRALTIGLLVYVSGFVASSLMDYVQGTV